MAIEKVIIQNFKKFKNPFEIKFNENINLLERWIRTTEVERQQIYSLPHLATLVFAQLTFKEQQLLSIFS